MRRNNPQQDAKGRRRPSSVGYVLGQLVVDVARHAQGKPLPCPVLVLDLGGTPLLHLLRGPEGLHGRGKRKGGVVGCKVGVR